MKQLFVLSILALSLTSQAARVAVTDSGTDFQHQWLKDRALINVNEIPGNMVDDDRNGKVDDVVGWNFAENYGEVFFRDHLNSVSEKTYKIFEVLARVQAGTQTPEDEKFWKEEVVGLPDKEKQKLINDLNFYGQYAHGTHVSGIVAQASPQSRILSARVFPDTPPSGDTSVKGGVPVATNGVMDFLYKWMAQMTNGTFQAAASYLNEQKIEVANYSLGVSLQMLARGALALRGIKEPTADQLAAETKRIYAQYEPIGRKWIKSAPNTLFVIAAGNDGTDNDALPAFPANIREGNSITVAASHNYEKLADFSNTGRTTVDLAAPGVAIMSSVPSLDNKKILPMSGTSMAAPYIAGIAAQIRDENPQLTAAQVKEILMGTVDQKDWLKGKVISSGVVNAKRAVIAAQNSRTQPVAQAIAQARNVVSDMAVQRSLFRAQPSQNPEVLRDMKKVSDQVLF